MSSKELTKNEIQLLKRGLKFTPTPRQNTTELKNDVQEFGRKLRLLEYFNGREQNSDNSLVRNKSNFVPPKSNDNYLTLFSENLSNLHKPNTALSKKSHFSSSERKALQDLEKDDTIIIKEADKGGATIIMDKTFYRNKILELLSDTENYIQLPRNEDDIVIRKIEKLIKEYEHHLTQKRKTTSKILMENIKFLWTTQNT